MPRRKISIEEAFRVLEEAGIEVQVNQVHDVREEKIDSLTPEGKLDYTQYPPVPLKETELPTSVKVTLFAKHSVGCGGINQGTDKNPHISGNEVYTFGPGVCWVPRNLAAHLLYQDALAQEADRKMLDREHRQYLIVERRGPSQRVNIGLQVQDLGDILSLSDPRNIHVI